ncbi:1,2-phenylacetyl-CoA epoxidase subunit PaaC [Asticcacaulis sp. EMRT-3]|uniref:1,2-phenylacetyl-CoA epoxidase subunit PaaC n=1 Tax=Asticcacaulis sp. EMRT-3 TaxID=3040349 RepID=UPI0024AE9C4D|nr:1,2-phenylacetyl-CoA epoxidase subunit PaaC [Asticcacaulis sp. EMRT-3]MDI7773928.1 phenylacetate-CoA oxygenase subunit PaaC [Asticcacaulis sp. EMRT-3]
MPTPYFDYTLRLGDDALILGQRLSAWAGHAPSLEIDLGLSNLALDLVGQATFWLELAAQHDSQGRKADTLAFHRGPQDFHNCLLVEQPNGDFAQTLARQFLYSNYQALLMEALSGSTDKTLAETADKCTPDITYHVEFATDWMMRLGDGDCLSHKRLVKSLGYMWHFIDELFMMDEVDNALLQQGISVDKAALRHPYDARIAHVLHDIGIAVPEGMRPVILGRKGHDCEHVAFMLHDMNIPPHDGRETPW